MSESVASWFRELATWPALKGACACVVSFALEAVGHPDSAFIWLFYLMMADYVLGFVHAWKINDIRRDKLTKGAHKFVFVWVSVALLMMVDKSLSRAFAVDALPYKLQDFYIAYLCLGEFFSCAAHLAFFGLKYPAVIMTKLHAYRARLDSEPWDGTERRR